MVKRAIGALLAGGLALTAFPALAQEGVLFQNIMRNLGVGGGPTDSDIEYRERPPLVVPPGSALPRPQDPAGDRTAAWPNDPDVAARRAAANDLLTPATQREKYRLDRNPLLSQEELRRGRVDGRGNPLTPPRNSQNAVASKTFDENIEPIRTGREIAARRNEDDLTKLTYGTEPERRYLYEPPSGYRRPAGSAPLGPGQSGPREDKQAVGQKEFAQGLPPPTLPPQ